MEKFDVLEFGLGGILGRNFDTPDDYMSGYRKHLESFLEKAHEETLVIDKRKVLERDPTLSIRSPMLNLSLDRGKVDRLGQIDEMFVAGLEGSFAGMAKLHNETRGKKEPGFLDSVSIDLFVLFWIKNEAEVTTLSEWKKTHSEEVKNGGLA